MGKIIKKRIEYGGSSDSAENIKYDDTKNVKEAINEVKSEIADVNSNFKRIPMVFNPNSGFELMLNTSFIQNSIAYINLRFKCSPKISSRSDIGYFTNITFQNIYRFPVACASIFDNTLDKKSNGYILQTGNLYVGDGLDGSVEEINVCISASILL